jgi:osmotically-inducible protein OsmY
MQKPHTPNSLLESDVKEAFDYDPMLDQSRIVVKVNDGRVRLTGAVASFDDVERATKDVHLVAGVKAVDNQLLVGPSGAAVADREVAKPCALALEADRIIPTGSVTVEVKDGYVALFGKVRNHFQRIAAEHAVGRVDGVLGVTDLITLTLEPIPSDVRPVSIRPLNATPTSMTP